jgi:hypothetical protein
MVVNWPGLVIMMVPPQQHWQVEMLSRAGMPPMRQVAAPGFHGVVTGMQGMGVSTPKAAAVAAATVGLASEMHIPNGGIFVMGAKSMIVAAGVVAKVLFVGSTIREEGAKPKGTHCIIAPMVTS